MIRLLHALFLALFFILSTSAATAKVTVTYFHNDISGSPMLATDAAGNVVWKESYRPYGQKLRDETASQDGKNKIGFAGSPFDASTGLSHMGARYYDPVIGRFMGVDPVGFQEGNVHSFNRYAYANNNPYKFIDPDGRIAILAAVPAIISALTPIAYAISTRIATSSVYRFGMAMAAGEVGLVAPAGVAAGGVAVKGAIGATGKVGEDALKLLGGESQAFFKTTTGPRYVDQLVNGVANESKVGYTSLTPNIRRQIAKDKELIDSNQVNSATWHFFTSPVTGKSGPSEPLSNALQKSGIDVINN